MDATVCASPSAVSVTRIPRDAVEDERAVLVHSEPGTQVDPAQEAEEKRLEKLVETMRGLWGDSRVIEERLELHEDTTRALEELAVRIWGSRQSFGAHESMMRWRQERREFWVTAISDWLEGIECAKKGLPILRELVTCYKNLYETSVKKPSKSAAERERISELWGKYLALSRVVITIDRKFLESGLSFMECEENFKKWDQQQAREESDESEESSGSERWEDEKLSMERARRAIEENKMELETGWKVVEEDRSRLEVERSRLDEYRNHLNLSVQQQMRTAWSEWMVQRRAMEQEQARAAGRHSREGLWKRFLRKSRIFGKASE